MTSDIDELTALNRDFVTSVQNSARQNQRRSARRLTLKHRGIVRLKLTPLLDWRRAIPRRYENYTDRLLEKFVRRCDQQSLPQRAYHRRIAVQPTRTGDA